MFKLIKIMNDEVTRDIVFESIETKKKYQVFDDSDILGKNQFDFLKVNQTYNCKFSIFGSVDNTGQEFNVIGLKKIGYMDFAKIQNMVGDIFYFPNSSKFKENGIVHIKVDRYDLIEVNGIIHDRSLTNLMK